MKRIRVQEISMKKILIHVFSVFMILSLVSFSFGQDQERKLFNAVSISPGIGFEYFKRTINWDDDQYTSEIKSRLFTFGTEVELQRGVFVRAFLGFSSTEYESMVFRELPVSVQLNVGYINGYVLGADVKKSIVQSEDLKVDAFGQFFFCSGGKKEWEIPGLPVEGTVEGRPTWMRATIGPVFTYTGFDVLYPYLYLNFNKFWGKFNMDQTIQDLTGREEKKILGEGSFGISLGFTFKLTESLSLRSEATFIPYKDGTDSGIMVKAMYTLY